MNMGNGLTSCSRKSTLTDAELEELGKNALKERDILLEKYPHLIEFQKKIDQMMTGAGTFENRMAVLAILMESNIKELNKHLMHLSRITQKMSDD
jgi:hypothetical protein